MLKNNDFQFSIMEIVYSEVGIRNGDKILDGIHNELRDLLYFQAKESIRKDFES